VVDSCGQVTWVGTQAGRGVGDGTFGRVATLAAVSGGRNGVAEAANGAWTYWGENRVRNFVGAVAICNP